jgi:hypothetical protein
MSKEKDAITLIVGIIALNTLQKTAYATTFKQYAETPRWRHWATADYIQKYKNYLTNDITNYPEHYTTQIEQDFGYTIYPTPTGKMDLVLDPASQGGARTGTIFNEYGISISPDSVYNTYNNIQGYWYKILSLHETVNVWTGTLAHNWPWADGSPLWKTSSPFPNMCDIIITSELALTDISQTHYQRMQNDTGVQLLYKIQRAYGWTPYRTLFTLTNQYHIKDWKTYPEPLRTAIICLFMSSGARTNLLTAFQQVVDITEEAFSQAQTLFPDVSY